MLRQIIKAKLPEFIPIADKPLRLGGKVEYLPPAELEKRLNIKKYDESIYIDPQLEEKVRNTRFKSNIAGYSPENELVSQTQRVINNPRNDLVICKMSDEKLGHGLFALKSIPSNTVLFIYGGTIQQARMEKTAKGHHALMYYGSNLVFNASEYRGLASYLQHLPETPRFPDAKTLSQVLKITGQDVPVETLKLNVELYSTEFKDSKIRNKIATENVQREYINFNGVPLIVFVTNRNIEKGEQLGFNYGCDYWLDINRKKVPEYFDKEGHVIPPSAYKRTCGQLCFSGFTCTGELQPYIDLLKTGKSKVKLIDDEKKDHWIEIDKIRQELIRVRALPAVMPSPVHIQGRGRERARLFTPVSFLPAEAKLTTIQVIDDNSAAVISSYSNLTIENYQRFLLLYSMIGDKIITKVPSSTSTEIIYKIPKSWLEKITPSGVAEIAELLGAPKDNFREHVKLPQKERSNICSK